MTRQGEIDYFKNIGHEGLAHALNKPYSDFHCGRYLMELGAIMALLPPPPAKLLDLGCGTGWTSFFFARRGYDVTGQDISEVAIRWANRGREREGLDHLRFVVGDYETMSFDNEFDCAVFFDSLHHADHEEDAIRGVYRALKAGGICVTSEPGIGHERSRSSIDAVRKWRVTEKDMPPRRIIKAGQKAGFKNFETYPHTTSNAVIYGRPDAQGAAGKWFRWKPIQTLAALSVILFYKRLSGIVVMTK